jgi:hypothetical protein
MRLESNKTASDGMMLTLNSGGSVTELSVTDRCRDGTVMELPWDHRYPRAVPFCSLSKS